MAQHTDSVSLAQALIQRPSVTPDDHGAIEVLANTASAIGFTCHRLDFQTPGKPLIRNLFASIGEGSPHICFAGHTDVVPPGPRERWKSEPFGGTIQNGMLSGRGAVDMKGAIAAFLSAAHRHLASSGLGTGGTISLLITGDEEGEAIDGTSRVLQWMAERQIRPDFCVVGEPTSQSILGDTIKIGRRGSLNGRITVTGAEGHVAYPHLAHNPIPILLAILNRLLARRFDDKSHQFDASNLEVVSVDVGNTATNVIPGQARAIFNIRFNTAHTGAKLSEWIRREAADAAAGQTVKIELDIAVSGEPFLTEPGVWTDMMREAIRAVTGRTPTLSTTGGTSDARFISQYFPVAEFGLVGQTMHKPDECVPIAELEQLTEIYSAMLNRLFGGARS